MNALFVRVNLGPEVRSPDASAYNLKQRADISKLTLSAKAALQDAMCRIPFRFWERDAALLSVAQLIFR
jgi:hypothetical protein